MKNLFKIISFILLFLSFTSTANAESVTYISSGCPSLGTGLIFSAVSFMLCHIVVIFVIAFFLGIGVAIYKYLKGE